VVDVIGIWLYYVKEVRFISLLYVILLVLATRGLISWVKAEAAEQRRPPPPDDAAQC
jgi:nicotinamide riboside transporter PnuC